MNYITWACECQVVPAGPNSISKATEFLHHCQHHSDSNNVLGTVRKTRAAVSSIRVFEYSTSRGVVYSPPGHAAIRLPSWLVGRLQATTALRLTMRLYVFQFGQAACRCFTHVICTCIPCRITACVTEFRQRSLGDLEAESVSPLSARPAERPRPATSGFGRLRAVPDLRKDIGDERGARHGQPWKSPAGRGSFGFIPCLVAVPTQQCTRQHECVETLGRIRYTHSGGRQMLR